MNKVTRNPGGSWNVEFEDGYIIKWIFAKDSIEAEKVAIQMRKEGRN
jgi:hypothetical protein